MNESSPTGAADSLVMDIDFLKNTIVGENNPGRSCGRQDVERHFETLERGFLGKPSLSFELVKIIVLIRRGIALEQNVKLFFTIIEAEIDFLLNVLSTRWIISIADTYADHGTDLQQATAVMIIAPFNMIKLTETERLIMADNHHDEHKIELNDQRRARREPLELWDGMTTYSLRHGDMPRNMIARMRRIAARDRVLSRIFDTLLQRALAGETILSRLAAYHTRFMPADWPVATPVPPISG